MSTLVVLLLGLTLVVALGFFFVRLDRREDQKEKEQEAEHVKWMQEYAKELTEERRSQEALAAEFEAKTWPEVRALREAEHGQPCECATKAKAARHVWWTRARRAMSSEQAR